MKKIVYIFCLIFVFVLALNCNFVPNVFAADDGAIAITDASDFMAINENGNYILANDIDFQGRAFTSISSFKGTLNGNGYTISNFSMSDPIFLNTQNATIKNLQIKNVNLVMLQGQTITKCAILVGTSSSTFIENCSFVGENSITLYSTSSIYAGCVVADAKEGTFIYNCHVECDITVDGNNNSKNYYIGGIVGKNQYSKILNVTISSNLLIQNLKNGCVGGALGFTSGNNDVKNIVFDGNITNDNCENLLCGSFVGEVSCPSGCPDNYTLNYFYTDADIEYLGNVNVLEDYYQNSIINYDVSKLVAGKVNQASMYLKDFYNSKKDENGNFDPDTKWDFDNIWQINEKSDLPYLQHFSTFTFSQSQTSSFSEFEKKPQGNVIQFINSNSNFRYGDQIVIGGYITNNLQLNKFFRIIGLKKDNVEIISNNDIMKVVQLGEGKIIDENTTEYSLSGRDVVVSNVTLSGYSAKLYTLKDSKISWGFYNTVQGDNINVYLINNCNLTDQGEYSFKLETITYDMTIKTENVDHGSVKRTTAEENVRKEIITESVTYGNSLGYEAKPTDDFAFNNWKIGQGSYDLSIIQFDFNENTFTTNGVFNGFVLGEDNLEIVATFTKNVTNVTIKFAVNNVIVDEILSKVYIDNVEQSLVDGIYFTKLKMGSTHNFKVLEQAGYEFTNWYLSDGTTNLGTISEYLETAFSTNNEESIVLVANFYKEIEETGNNSFIWWIVGGVGAALVLVGIIVLVIIKKRKNNSYKNYYY